MKCIVIMLVMLVSAEGGARVSAPRVRVSAPKVKVAGARRARGSKQTRQQRAIIALGKEAKY